MQHFDSFFGGDGVGDVAEVNAADKLFGGEVYDEFPEWLGNGFGPEVP